MPCTSSPLPLQPRYSQLIRQSRAVLHCAPPGLFAIKKERIPCRPRHCVDEWTGWRSERKGDEEGEKDEYEDTRDRAVDTVNGRERSRDPRNKIAEKFERVPSYRHFGNSSLVTYRPRHGFSHLASNNPLFRFLLAR